MEGHISVLLEESTEGLNIKPDAKIIDGTIDGGGHAERFLQELGPEGRILGIDWDPDMGERLTKRFPNEKRLKLINSNYGRLEQLARSFTFWPDAIFLDLGLSSFQLQYASGRGFSFKNNEPLEMTFSPLTHPNAKEWLGIASETEIGEVLRTYGEEWQAKKIARAIVEARKRKAITTTGELAEIVTGSVPRRGRIHPATKTFQAIRIYINHELENLEHALEGGWKVLKPEGRMGIISFHSLEDRIVKSFFKDKARGWATLITKKPIRPKREEILLNPRSRSAKLRIIQKNDPNN